MKLKPKQTFFNAFSPPFGCNQSECNCGLIYFSADDVENDSDLFTNEKAVGLDHGVGFVVFEGRQYVWDCECWHDRAVQIQSFIDGHNQQIADYLNGEAKRIKEAANNAPLVG